MSEYGRSTWVRIYSGATTYQRWQNYYLGQTVSSHAYLPFNVGALVISADGDQSGLTLTLPATTEVIDAIEAAIAGLRLVEVTVYSFEDPAISNTTPAGQTLLSTFLGEVTDCSATLSSLSVTLGTSLAPIGAQIPRLRFTPELVGYPYRP
jgi:hypothetical protein